MPHPVLVSMALVIAALLPVPAAASSTVPGTGTTAATCTDVVGPGMAPPAAVELGIPGYHAAWWGQTGSAVLCPGRTVRATVGFMNTGTLGWYAGVPGAAAALGTWGPDPGQDQPSVLGGVDVGWLGPARVAPQSAPYIGPGQVSWFEFTLRAPAAPGTYRLSLRPVIDGTTWMEDEGVSWTVVVKSDDTSPVSLPQLAPPSPSVARTYYPATAADGSRTIRVSALMYHYVEWLPPNADALRKDLTVSPTDFEAHLRYLVENGYHAITAADLWWSLTAGAPLPPKPVLLTFDDGYADAYDVVLPLLKKYGMVGTFAVVANLVDRPGYLTHDQVRALSDAGMDVESHSTDHVALSPLPYEEQAYQLCTSRRIISGWTGKDVRQFIYPSGYYLPLPAAALTACGYLGAYRKDGGSVQSSNEMFALRRARVRGQQGLAALLAALAQ